jgi:hypothetical protein
VGKAKRLRPMGTADLLDETVELFKSNFVLIVGISAMVNLPSGLVNVLATLHPRLLGLNYLLLLLSIALAPVVTGALIFGIADRHLQLPTSIRACYRRALTRSVYWPLLGVGILQGLLLMGCLMVGAVPAIAVGVIAAVTSDRSNYAFVSGMFAGMLLSVLATAPLWVRLMLAGPVAVIEKTGSGSAIGRSWSLISGSVLRSTLVIIVANVLVYAVPIILGQLIGPLTGHRMYYDIPFLYRAGQQGIGILLNVVVAPIVAIAQTLLYFDLRMRKEGFDLELLAREMERK